MITTDDINFWLMILVAIVTTIGLYLQVTILKKLDERPKLKK